MRLGIESLLHKYSALCTFVFIRKMSSLRKASQAKGWVRGINKLSLPINVLTTLGIVLFLTSPLYGQSFGSLVDELSGSETEQAESDTSSQPEKQEAKPLPPSLLPPSSNELQAIELENTPEEDDLVPEKNVVTNGVTLQGLDKQTARVFIIDAHLGQPVEFGTLKIVVRHCEKAPLENRQESMAFINITEQKPNSSVNNLFSGWMFSSSPALSALDHPTYDVWVKECKVMH